MGGEGGGVNLNSRYTFRTFIVGSANRLAHAASLSVAERPGEAYNPLFLYGGVGLGKTHLMHAVGNAVVARFPRKRVVYATSEKFTNDFITSIQQGRIDDFRARYRKIDLLLIDDIQFIADKERTQEEFFHTFNAIHEDGKQIVLSSDRPPKQITTLEERLRSRFEWGLIADLTAPDLETRIAILRTKSEEQGVRVGPEALEFIARKVVSNIRELEGALNRIVAYASMQGMPISVDLAQAVLSNVLYSPRKRAVTPERIAAAVSDYYDVDLEALRGQKRDRAIVVPTADRHVPHARGDGRLAPAHRRGVGWARSLHRAARLPEDRPGGRAQRGVASRTGRCPGSHLLRALGSHRGRSYPIGSCPVAGEPPGRRHSCPAHPGGWGTDGGRRALLRGSRRTYVVDGCGHALVGSWTAQHSIHMAARIVHARFTARPPSWTRSVARGSRCERTGCPHNPHHEEDDEMRRLDSPLTIPQGAHRS